MANRFPSRYVWMTGVVGIVANGAGCSHDARPSGFGTSADPDASEASNPGDFGPPAVPSCYPECPEPSPCGGGNFGCPEGLVRENGCCDTCTQSTGVRGSFAVDDGGRCPEGSVAEGPCCAVCSNIGPGAVTMGDAGACPGDLVPVGSGCCAPCSDLLSGAVARGADAGTCPDGFGRVGASWGGASHEVQCCLQLPLGSAHSLDAGVVDAGDDGG